MNTELQLAKKCIAALAVEGVDAHMEFNDGGSLRLRVPAWEAEDTDLCRLTVFEFIHRKLGGQRSKGFVTKTPISGIVEVYTYDPCCFEAGKPVSASDMLAWGYGASVDEFDWTAVVEPDGGAWEDGYDSHHEMGHLTQRLGFLSCLLNYEIVDLPAVKPLTRLELQDEILSGANSGLAYIYCRSDKKDERLILALNQQDQLVLNKRSDNSDTLITDNHFDEHGRLVFEGAVILHRTWPR